MNWKGPRYIWREQCYERSSLRKVRAAASMTDDDRNMTVGLNFVLSCLAFDGGGGRGWRTRSRCYLSIHTKHSEDRSVDQSCCPPPRASRQQLNAIDSLRIMASTTTFKLLETENGTSKASFFT